TGQQGFILLFEQLIGSNQCCCTGSDGCAGLETFIFCNSFDYKIDILRTLCETSHEVCIPVVAEWHIYYSMISALHEISLIVFPETVQHLEFILIIRDIVFFNEIDCFFNYIMVMCRNGRKAASFKQVCFYESQICGINISFVLKSDFRRFFVRAFYKTESL